MLFCFEMSAAAPTSKSHLHTDRWPSWQAMYMGVAPSSSALVFERVGRFVGVIMRRQLRNVREFAEALGALPGEEESDSDESEIERETEALTEEEDDEDDEDDDDDERSDDEEDDDDDDDDDDDGNDDVM